MSPRSCFFVVCAFALCAIAADSPPIYFGCQVAADMVMKTTGLGKDYILTGKFFLDSDFSHWYLTMNHPAYGTVFIRETIFSPLTHTMYALTVDTTTFAISLHKDRSYADAATYAPSTPAFLRVCDEDPTLSVMNILATYSQYLLLSDAFVNKTDDPVYSILDDTVKITSHTSTVDLGDYHFRFFVDEQDPTRFLGMDGFVGPIGVTTNFIYHDALSPEASAITMKKLYSEQFVETMASTPENLKLIEEIQNLPLTPEMFGKEECPLTAELNYAPEAPDDDDDDDDDDESSSSGAHTLSVSMLVVVLAACLLFTLL